MKSGALGGARFDPEYDDVYASIAMGFRNARRGAGVDGGVPAERFRLTKGDVATVHRKMQAGEALTGDQEQAIADRLRRQIGDGA